MCELSRSFAAGIQDLRDGEIIPSRCVMTTSLVARFCTEYIPFHRPRLGMISIQQPLARVQLHSKQDHRVEKYFHPSCGRNRDDNGMNHLPYKYRSNSMAS
jgi:hypothetical protein